MDVSGLLRRAAALVSPDARSDAGACSNDAVDYLNHSEWELALDILTDFDGLTWHTVEYWDLLATAAGHMSREHDAAWCRWRASETRHGVIRVDLQLADPGTSGRRSPIPGAGVLRPMWAFSATPGPDTPRHIARMWVEFLPALPPGGRASVRLLPLAPESWAHLAPGDVITMYEAEPVSGVATIIQVLQAGGGAPGQPGDT
ncbi:hypothetical protein LX15_006260 [Streptoalloteichus tenebrarius]|uniref:Uncharacterized protein n=1 Tax=Streptoalloteichus tenebrarius (strain ATCC 17920 / DSM 40477 / JCM 4838 / CBS 697.72 / NBRC 16177 / NCIMB 11028 / NRRL B-12390 / A12253. 1 / ISP 5477) TaxID=1933 RepID=A0ABT1I4M0_STRSD|nr:hypothetical protein [Streptoalloteichus tenebrarius]MCP2262520.1 hypothetical protein [Streptoalloteichus tenebrarius]BFE99117.1 hypothetical protein GCM10020241_07930 [Streptoalloteichus tenebrarius]